MDYMKVRDPSQLSFKEQAARICIDPSFKPRWYQQEAVDSIFNYFYEGGKGNPLVVVPTGAGKSHILGMFCKNVLASWPDQQILILTHVDTIIEQDYLALRKHLPSHQVGIYSASVGLRQRRSVTIAGIQSVTKKPHLFKGSTILLVDECHLIPHSKNGQYRSFLQHFQVPVVGLTATHFRLGQGYLHEGEERLFTDIAYEVDILRLVDEGYLCPLVPKSPKEHIDLTGVRTQGGDYVKKDISAAATRDGITDSICTELLQYVNKYKKWLVFAVDIEHAILIQTTLKEKGVSAGIVHSKQSKGKNDDEKIKFKIGEYQVLVSVESLTTGFDVPEVDLIVLLRPTQSPVLHIQMIGRGLRIHPSKDHCLVLDFAGNIERLGPINDVLVKVKGKGKGSPIMKACPVCQTLMSGSVRVCSVCDHLFLFETKLEEEASKEEIIKTKNKKKKKEKITSTHAVLSVAYGLHQSATSGKFTLHIVYNCDKRTFHEYVSFSRATKKYNIMWWRRRSILYEALTPQSEREALQRALKGELRTPMKLLVEEGGNYPEIKKHYFSTGEIYQ